MERSSRNFHRRTMFKLIYFCMCLMVTSSTFAERTKYTQKYDNVDIDDILKNDRLLLNYVNCLMERGSCTPDGLELRKNMPDAIETDCSKCSEKQQQGSQTIMHFLIDHKPDLWKELQAKYDADGSYMKRYQENQRSEVAAEPITL